MGTPAPTKEPHTHDPALPPAEVRWNGALLEAELEAMVNAWQRSLHGFTKRLSPEVAARFAMALDSAIYSIHGETAVAANGGLHPKHHILKHHDWFVAHLSRGETVIDLGSGVGALARSMAEKAGAIVTGMDWSEKNLAKAREVTKGVEPGPRFVLGDITGDKAEVPSGGRFDVVVLSNVLEHIDRRVERLRMWREWYGPERFLIRVPAFDRDWRVAWKKSLGVEWRCDPTHETEYTREQLVEELGAAGLRAGEVTTCWGEYWVEAKA